jgi:glucose dehydrogenase
VTFNEEGPTTVREFKLMKARLAFLLATTLLAGTGAARAATWEQIMHAGGQSADWLVYGGNLANTRYVDNAEINSSNVGRLHLKWMFQTGVIGSFENTPIVEDGVMYVTSPYDHVFAIDARTGRQLWHYE